MTENWQPSASIDLLKKRAQFMAAIRQFFSQNSYLEVETPYLAQHGVTDLYLANIQALFRKETYYLQTSPEYHMKRLLAAGSGPIFQLARVFRDDELGSWHNPEFTLLEWYQLDVDHYYLMDETDRLLQILAGAKPLIKMTYQEAFIKASDVDPFEASIDDLKQTLKKYHLDQILSAQEEDKDQYLFLLMSHVVEPFLGKEKAPVAVYHFPPSQASLARIENNRAQRFEVYWQGVELANGFYELIDPELQKERFVGEQLIRAKKNLTSMTVDPYLLSALKHGLPNCSGVALGVDRLLALALKQTNISKIMSFDFSRA